MSGNVLNRICWLLLCLLLEACAQQAPAGSPMPPQDDVEIGLDGQDLPGIDDIGADEVLDGSQSADDGTTTDDGESTDSTGPCDLDGDIGPACDGTADLELDGTADVTPDPGDEDAQAFVPLFDLEAIRDPVSADCTYTDQRTTWYGITPVDAWNASFWSWESVDGELVPILIRGYAARPSVLEGPLPGVVQAHGLGGSASLDQAAEVALLTGSVVISYSGPGSGSAPENTSEGSGPMADEGRRLWDTVPDLRGSWFWAHTVAGMRALTCLEARDDVDGAHLGMTGFSAGSIVTLTAVAVDDRLVAAVPMSGTGSLAIAAQSPNAWEHALLTQAGLTTDSEQWLRYVNELDPAVLVGDSSAAILLLNGSTDEFFPLTAHRSTYEAIGDEQKRTSIIGNYDHGCYSISGVEDRQDIEQRAELHMKGGLVMWFGHYFGTDPRFAHVPDEPTVNASAQGALSLVTAQVDTGSSDLEVDEVRVFWSNDDSLVYVHEELADVGGGMFAAVVPFPLQENTIYYVDVVYRTTEIFFPDRFAISSVPSIPDALIPRIRSITTCLP